MADSSWFSWACGPRRACPLAQGETARCRCDESGWCRAVGVRPASIITEPASCITGAGDFTYMSDPWRWAVTSSPVTVTTLPARCAK